MSDDTRPEFRKTILIGLGGAGQQIVLRTKRFFLDTYGVVPPSVKILCLDTDDEALSLRSETTNATYAIEPSEFMHLQVDNPPEFIKASSDVGKWYVSPVPVNAISHGAGAVRQNGRLAFFRYVTEIRQRVDKMLSDLNDTRLPGRMSHALEHCGLTTGFALSNRATEIYVCGSIAGGTGSGTFLDMGLLLRRMEQNALVHGFFLLPWVYRNKPFAYRIRQNAYAALAELDNLQSVMFTGKNTSGYGEQFYKYKINYADLQVEVDKAPYDLFHVIDGRNDYGQNIDSVHELCEVVANAVFLSMGPMSVHVASVVDNLLSFLTAGDPRIWKNRYARYSSLNVSSIHYPARELHRLVSASNALELCRSAIRQVESGAAMADTTGADATREQAKLEAGRFITELNLHRSNVQARICPRRSPITFQVEAFEIADADFGALMRQRLDGEKKALEKGLEQSFDGQARVFMDEVTRSLDQEIKRRAADPKLDRTQRREWGATLLDHLSRLHDDVSKEVVQATTQVGDLGKDAEALFEIAQNSHYIPLIGGHRKSAANAWAGRIGELLTQTQAARNLEQEKAFYERLLKLLQSAIAVAVPSSSDIHNALLKTEEVLQQQVRLEDKNLDILRSRPNHVLLGHGRIVVLPAGTSPAGSSGGRVKVKPLDEIACTYPQFVADEKIYSAERYLDLFEESPVRLAALFRDYCNRQLDYIKDVPVDTALDTLAEHAGDPVAFKRDKFDDLFRLASPLWSFDRGRLSEQQALRTDKIINIGFCDRDKDVPRYWQIAQDSKNSFNIQPDLAYSATGDAQHIWMLCFAAAIPAYLLDGMEEAKRMYEEQITPTYHIDSAFEMNVPDLFPEEENANLALRLLGMAIVEGIDIIVDKKLTKGHEFTFDNEVTRSLNYGDPIVWHLFRDMYEKIKSNDSGLLDLLNERLVARVQSMHTTDVAKLRSCIEQQIDKLNDKLARRDFSRLVSARLTYREIKALEDFLKNNRFAMKMDHYIAGTYVPPGHVHVK